MQKNCLLLSTLIICGVLFSCKTKKEFSINSKKNFSELHALQINKSLSKEIQEWLGVKYRYGGNDKKGVDCSGFVNAIYREVYNTQLSRTSKSIYNECEKVKNKSLREGDLVFFNYDGKGISHVGIYLQNDKFVHASSSKGVVISSLDHPYNQKHFVGGGRVKK